MSNRGALWTSVNIDPTAGVTLAPKMRECPRCGHEKGPMRNTRPGLCKDCADTIPREDRAEWRRAA